VKSSRMPTRQIPWTNTRSSKVLDAALLTRTRPVRRHIERSCLSSRKPSMMKVPCFYVSPPSYVAVRDHRILQSWIPRPESMSSRSKAFRSIACARCTREAQLRSRTIQIFRERTRRVRQHARCSRLRTPQLVTLVAILISRFNPGSFFRA
jgi:hypothetical protein